ncbi:metallophosphoesterase family protein [Viridibacillus arvi]|uniref:metallophosphoesterase family protein n=1 Tax=Viridibacillus arvi TaxID=263475 RepID=UPI003CFC9C5C
MSSKQPIFSFFVISDIQLTELDLVSQQKLASALQDINDVNPEVEALIINGDLVNNGESKSYEIFKRIIEKNPHPEQTYYTIGNHEFFKNDGNEPSIQRFLNFSNLENVYDDAMIHEYPFLFLGTESWGPIGSPTKDSAVLSEQQLNWLEEKVNALKQDNKPVFVFLHQPLPYSTYETDLEYYQNGVIQDKEVRNLLSKLKHAFLFAGHSHWDLRNPNMLVKQETTFVSTGAIFNTWGPNGEGGDTVVNSDGSQGLYVQVFHDSIQIAGRDFANKQWIQEFDHKIML